MNNISLRDADINDSDLVFKWRNDPWIIAKGSLNKKVEKTEHEKWFSDFIQNQHCHMFIISIDNEAAGQVRFMGSEEQSYAEISIYLLEDYIGHGAGVAAIEKACSAMMAQSDLKTIVAYILQGNKQSQRAFEKAGFVLADKCDMTDIKNKSDHQTYIYTD